MAFVAVKENIRFEGRQDLQTKVMTTLFAEDCLSAPRSGSRVAPSTTRRRPSRLSGPAR